MRSRRWITTILALALGSALTPSLAQQGQGSAGLRVSASTPPVHNSGRRVVFVPMTIENTGDTAVEVVIAREFAITDNMGNSWRISTQSRIDGLVYCGRSDLRNCEIAIARKEVRPTVIDAKSAITVSVTTVNLVQSAGERLSFSLPLLVRPESPSGTSAGPWRSVSLGLTNLAIEAR